jgi:hypothetical protein
MKTLKKYRVKIILCLFFAFLGLLSLEITSRLRYQGVLRLIRNTDHRLTPDGKEINSDSLRSRREAAEFQPADLNIMVLGDSFVYGWELPAEQAFPQQFEKLIAQAHPELKAKVINAGWHSSSPYLSLRLLKDVGRKYHPDIVFLCLDMTDFQDDIKYKHLLQRDTLIYKGVGVFPGLTTFLKKTLAGGRMRDSGWHETIFDMPVDRFFASNHPLSETRPWLATTQAAIDGIDRYARDELKAKFILVVLPRSFQYSDRECPNNWEKEDYEELGPYSREPFVYFDEIRSRVDYPIYSLLETFEKTTVFPTCFNDDPHWNPAGNAIVAQKLYDIGVEEGFLPTGDAGNPSPQPAEDAESSQP